MISRRRFLELGTLAGASFLIPKFLSGFSQASEFSGKKLVILQLTGGNDGLNTVVPFRNDIYYQLRPNVAIESRKLLRLNDDAGLHPSLKNLHSFYNDGALSIINNVGYANHSRSHFRSMDYWHTAGNIEGRTGWLGRYIDASTNNNRTVIEIDETISLALKGKHQEGHAIRTDRNLNTNGYPDTQFGARMKHAADLLNSDHPAQIIYLSHGSYDTHVSQQEYHANLLTQLDEALGAFVGDLQKSGMFNDVLILTFSEFGRRVAENEHKGTDHGAASNMFIISGGLRNPGLQNNLPALDDLDDGNAKHEIDFRQVYATVLERWLSTESKPILGSEYSQLNFL